jgi:CMP-N-acetylneuraminic acid synthetase
MNGLTGLFHSLIFYLNKAYNIWPAKCLKDITFNEPTTSYMKVNVLMPIKAYSSRLKDKNFKSFNGKPLYQVILDKLHQVKYIDNIVVNTDSDIIALECPKLYSKVKILQRPDHLLDPNLTMNTLIDYDIQQVNGEHFFQTHCTNPLLSIKTIHETIEWYFNHLENYDSLFTVEKIQKRGYFEDGKPINHNNALLEQTQHMPSIYIENSNIFIFSRSSFLSTKSRIGKNPCLYEMDSFEGMDIDYETDFKKAELIAKNGALFGLAE